MLVPVTLFAAAVSDPLHWLNAVGITQGSPDWVYPAIWRQSICFALCLLWLLGWYHRQRVAFDERQTATPDIPLYKVCQYIARDSNWAASYKARDDDWVGKVDSELQSKLLLGAVCAFGIYRPDHGPTQSAHNIIPRDVFEYAKWKSQDLVSENPPTHFWRDSGRGGGIWANVMLNRAQVETAWPRRSLLKKMTRQSPVERIDGLEYRRIFAEQDKHYKASEAAPTQSYGYDNV